MEDATETEITLFEALLNETEPGMASLMLDLLDLPGGTVGTAEQEWTGPDRRATAA